jgi:hypothetical protein
MAAIVPAIPRMVRTFNHTTKQVVRNTDVPVSDWPLMFGARVRVHAVDATANTMVAFAHRGTTTLSGPQFSISPFHVAWGQYWGFVRYTQASGFVAFSSGIYAARGAWYSVAVAQLSNTDGRIYINGREVATNATSYVFPGLVSGDPYNDPVLNAFSVGGAATQNASTSDVTGATTCDVCDVFVGNPSSSALALSMAYAHHNGRVREASGLLRYYPLDTRTGGDHDQRTRSVRLDSYSGAASTTPTALAYTKYDTGREYDYWSSGSAAVVVPPHLFGRIA